AQASLPKTDIFFTAITSAAVRGRAGIYAQSLRGVSHSIERVVKEKLPPWVQLHPRLSLQGTPFRYWVVAYWQPRRDQTASVNPQHDVSGCPIGMEARRVRPGSALSPQHTGP